MIRPLPTVDIAGERYYVDLRLNELRHVADFSNRIDMDRDLWETENGFVLAYDTRNKCVFRGTRAEFEERIRRDVVEVHLAPLSQLDPVGFAQLVEQWKRDNPLLCAMIEAIPTVLNEPATPSQQPTVADKRWLLPKKIRHLLLPKRGKRNHKGKRL